MPQEGAWRGHGRNISIIKRLQIAQFLRQDQAKAALIGAYIKRGVMKVAGRWCSAGGCWCSRYIYQPIEGN